MSKEKYRARVHALLLYPEDSTHCQAIEKITKSYDYAMILHDKDYYTEGENAGEIKKAHWHIVLRFKQAVWSSAVCKELGIEQNYIEQVRKFDNALQYLIHYNDSNKAQYTIDEVQGTLKPRLIESINKGEKSEGEKVIELIEYIDSSQSKISIREFASYCAKQGYWAEFRRSASIFIKILDEHNSRF